jgi:hypothetical protein
MKTLPTWGPSDRPAMLAFERYFQWADTMRKHFRERSHDYPDERRAHWEPYMAYWYGGLYAVTEGWRRLRFRDGIIGGLMKAQEKMAILREYRVGAFHFQPRYFDPRFLALWERDDVVDWADTLHRQFDRWIREELPKVEASTFPQQPRRDS